MIPPTELQAAGSSRKTAGSSGDTIMTFHLAGNTEEAAGSSGNTIKTFNLAKNTEEAADDSSVCSGDPCSLQENYDDDEGEKAAIQWHISHPQPFQCAGCTMPWVNLKCGRCTLVGV